MPMRSRTRARAAGPLVSRRCSPRCDAGVCATTTGRVGPATFLPAHDEPCQQPCSAACPRWWRARGAFERVRMAFSSRVRRPRLDLRDRRGSGAETGARARRQDDESAGCASHRRRSALWRDTPLTRRCRSGRLCPLAAHSSGHRTRTRGNRQHLRSPSGARQRDRLQRALHRRDPHSDERQGQLDDSQVGGSRGLRMARRHLDRRGGGSDRRSAWASIRATAA